MSKRNWSDLGGREKAFAAASFLVQTALLVGALVDIYRRPGEKVRGSKIVWVAVSFVNFVGPVSYFLFGRRR